MERLTEKCWRNLDPWECCGQDHYCTRGCHDLGGCTGGCIVPKLYRHLAAYEDAMPLERAQELAQLEKDGRLVVLPVPVGKGKVAYAIPDSFSRDQEIFTIECERLDGLEIWENPGREVVVVVDGCEVGESNIGKTVFLTHEEAEAALKKREEADDEDN